MSAGERLQKVLARGGIASRRHAEELIAAGRVRVNGKITTEPGTRVDPRNDKVELDGRRVLAEPLVYYVFHKPRGTVSTLVDPEGRATIAEYLKELPARVFPVGRLDFHTSGALLLTNDGELAQALLHPRKSVPKVYVAKVRGVPTDLQLEPMREGLMLAPVGDETEAVKTRPAEIDVMRHSEAGEGATTEWGTTWLRVTLREGRNRQIHRMAEAVGLFVMRLARISFAGVDTEGVRPGELRELTDKEVTTLRATYLRLVEQANAGAAKKAAAAAASRAPDREGREGREGRGTKPGGIARGDRGAPVGEGRGAGATTRGARVETTGRGPAKPVDGRVDRAGRGVAKKGDARTDASGPARGTRGVAQPERSGGGRSDRTRSRRP